MDDTKNYHVALLPIQPPYVEAILSGRKQVEFRRRPFGRDVGYIVIYATSPIKHVVGFFQVAQITMGTPLEIWERYQHVGGIERSSFRNYFNGAEQGVAIEIGHLHKLDKPITLSALGENLKAPQSFRYLDGTMFSRLQSKDSKSLRASA